MNLAEVDVRILHMIELNPTISIQTLAKRVNISWITANRHIERLKQKGILSNPIAVFEPATLGLERHIILFRADSENQLVSLEAACDIHPYTHYRTRIYGPYAGLFTQFDIPPKGKQNLHAFIEGMKERGVCDEFTGLRSTGCRTSTVTNIERFDAKESRWDYDWKTWSQAIDMASAELSEQEPAIQTPSLNSIDLNILKELTANANISQSELQEKYSISQSTASRKMIAVNENYIRSIRAQIDRSIFDVTSTKLFYCDSPDSHNRARVFNAFYSDEAPPFPLSVDLLENGSMIIWGRMPPSQEHHLYYTLWRYLKGIQVFTMDTVKGHSRLYWFYPENYDTTKKEWKTDLEWMVLTPLRLIDRGSSTNIVH